MTAHDCPHLRSDGRCNCSCSRCFIPVVSVPDVVTGGADGVCVCARCDTSVCTIHRKVTA